MSERTASHREVPETGENPEPINTIYWEEMGQMASFCETLKSKMWVSVRTTRKKATGYPHKFDPTPEQGEKESS